MSRGASRCGQDDPTRCYASEARDDWADAEYEKQKACARCGCTEPTRDCPRCTDEEEPVDIRDPYKDSIERQLIEDNERES